MPEQFPFIYIIHLIIRIISALPGAADTAFDHIGTYFFLAFFVPSFVIIVTLVIYFIVYFLIVVFVAWLMSATSALAGIPVYLKIPAGVIIAAITFIAVRWLKRRRPSGDVAVLHKLDASNSEKFGEKAASLGRLAASGLQVPFGYALSGAFFARYMKKNDVEAPPGNLSGDELEEALVRNARRIMNGKFGVVDSVRLRLVYTALTIRWGLDAAFIVRSSFSGEDVAGKLSPGQYKSYGSRNSFRSFQQAVRDCWRSFYNITAHEYRTRMKIAHEPFLPVVAQGQLKSELLGTAAAADPARGFREKVVVDFAAPPEEDSYLVTEQGDAETIVADMALSYPEPPADERLPFLPRLAADMRTLSNAMETTPVVEWAWAKGRLYYLQARPLAGLPVVKTYIAAGMVDVTPEPLTPMTISLIEKVRTLDSFITGPVGEYMKISGHKDILQVINSRIYADFDALEELAGEMTIDPRDFKKLFDFCTRKADKINKYLETLDGILGEFDKFDIKAAGIAQLHNWIIELNEEIQGRGAGFQASAAHLTQLFSTFFEQTVKRAGVPASRIHSLPVYEEGCVAAKRMSALHELEAAVAEEAGLYDIDRIPVEGGRAAALLADYVREFGYLGPGDEIDIAVPRIEEEQTEFIHRLAAGGGTGPAGDAPTESGGGKVNAFAIWKLLRTSGGQNFIPWDVPVVGFLHKWFRTYATIREETRYRLLRGWSLLRLMLLELASREPLASVLPEPGDIFFLTESELADAINGDVDAETLNRRKQKFSSDKEKYRSPVIHVGESGEIIIEEEIDTKDIKGRVFRGRAASSGTATGTARWISHPDDAQKVKEGDIAVVDVCSPWMSVLLARASGVAACSGGVVSHLALAAREYGRPMVVSVFELADISVDGVTMEINAETGTVKILEG